MGTSVVVGRSISDERAEAQSLVVVCARQRGLLVDAVAAPVICAAAAAARPTALMIHNTHPC